MILTIYLSIVFLSLLALHVALRYNKVARLLSKIPGPPSLPFIGNLLAFNVSPEKLWDTAVKIADDYYPIVRLWALNMNGIGIRHPDDMKILLSCKKNIEKCNTVYSKYRVLNNGLVFSAGDKWRQRRKMITPAFNPNLLKVYVDIVNEHTEQLIKDIKNENVELIPDISSIFLKHALRIICEAAMGVDIIKFGIKEEQEFREAFSMVTEIAYYRATRPYIPDWIMMHLSAGRRQLRAVKQIEEFTDKVIKERREYHKSTGFRNFQSIVDDFEDETSTGRKKRLAVLDLLLAAERDKLIDEEGIREEVETFAIAGYETSGMAMAFTLMLLAENKTVQELARDEVTAVLNETNGVLTIADINKLEYLERCIKETLRLYPSGPLIGRSITHDIKLSNYEIPHNTEVGIFIYSLHRDPNFWPDSEKFDPDRFLPEQVKERHPFAYLPFSAGPRGCIGYKFAMLEMKAVIARILYNFYLEPVDTTANMTFEMHMILKPKDPCRMKLISIDRALDSK